MASPVFDRGTLYRLVDKGTVKFVTEVWTVSLETAVIYPTEAETIQIRTVQSKENQKGSVSLDFTPVVCRDGFYEERGGSPIAY